MRLLKAKTFELHDFSGKIPAYAILSHRWEEPEILFQDVQAGKASRMTGFKKIEGCCNRAKEDDIEFVWIDTCCIDKTSSAELSEAINSMYQWYKNAQVCYAYLSDVEEGKHDQFKESRWFTRGWTLQELLAPSFVNFYDSSWNEIGTKGSLRNEIMEVTRINSLFDIDKACVAEKMSWASRRVTTRVEDTAYCLMGLFGVHMAPLYGEGRNAFIRLQREILSGSDDESIFAWQGYMSDQGGLLASSPKAFADSGDMKLCSYDEDRPQFTMTNKGLRLDLRLEQARSSSSIQPSTTKSDSPIEYLAPLNCGRLSDATDGILPVAIKLKQQGRPDQYTRVHHVGLELWKPPKDHKHPKRTTVYIKQPIASAIQKYPELFFKFQIKTTAISGYSISKCSCFCKRCESWDATGTSLTITENTSHCDPLSEMDCGAVLFSKKDSTNFVVVLGTSDRKHPTANIFVPEKPHELEMEVDKFNMSRDRDQQDFLLDRASKTIKGGTTVSIALRPIQTHEYLVDICLVEPDFVRPEDVALPEDVPENVSNASSDHFVVQNDLATVRTDSAIWDVFRFPTVNESLEDAEFFDNLKALESKLYDGTEPLGDFIIFEEPNEINDLRMVDNPNPNDGDDFDEYKKHRPEHLKQFESNRKRHMSTSSLSTVEAYQDLRFTFYPDEDLITLL